MNDYGNRVGGERTTLGGRGRQTMGNLYEWDPIRSLFGSNQHVFALDVQRKDDGYEIEMPVPGFRPEDLEVTYQDGVISVSGRNERRSFTRSLSIPDDVNEEAMEAKVEHGMLVLLLPQRRERQPRRINVAGSGMQHVGSQRSAQASDATTIGETSLNTQNAPRH